MRVDRRMTLAGKVLGAGRHAGGLKSRDPRGSVARDEHRIHPVRADADVGAVALRQHVEHWREVDIDAETTQLATLDDALTVDEGNLAGGSGGEIVGKDRHRSAEHDDAS